MQFQCNFPKNDCALDVNLLSSLFEMQIELFFLILNLLSVQRTKMKKKATLQFTSLVTLNKIFAQISYLKLRNSIPTSLTQKLKPSLFLLYVAKV